MKKRYCIKEKLETVAGLYRGETIIYTYVLKEWTYYYNDGTTETVTVRIRNES